MQHGKLGHGYKVKAGERIDTDVGERIKCPYCNLLYKDANLGGHGDSRYCSHCKKVFVLLRN